MVRSAATSSSSAAEQHCKHRRGRGHRLQAGLLGCAVLGHVLLGCEGSSSWAKKLDHGQLSGFPSHDEAVALLDSWLAQYPSMLRKQEIGTSFEKRKMYAYVISLNGKGPFQATPQVLLTSLMHSREPAGLTVLLYFMGHLLELYQQGDPEARYILQTREIWAIPFVNPDGYIANQKYGKKDRRKNMRASCGPTSKASSGVDINRNFGFHWSSQFGICDEEYAGTQPFSEPETMALKTVIESHHFVTAVNFHSFGGMLTHPFNYGKQPLPADDQRIYDEIAKVFKWPRFGPAIKTVGYTAPGESDDWMYAAHHIISMSPEVGPESGDFWPPSHLIAGIDTRNFARTKSVVQKAGFEMDCSWIHSPLKEDDLTMDVRESLKSAGGASHGALTLQLRNRGMSTTIGKALNLAISGATKPGASPKRLSTFIHNMGDKAKHLPVQLASMANDALAVVFQSSVLPRRSKNSFEVLIANDLVGRSKRNLRLCAFEVPDGLTSHQLCMCHGPADLPAENAGKQALAAAGTPVFVEGKSSGDELQQLCAAAVSFIADPMEPEPTAAPSTVQPAVTTELHPEPTAAPTTEQSALSASALTSPSPTSGTLQQSSNVESSVANVSPTPAQTQPQTMPMVKQEESSPTKLPYVQQANSGMSGVVIAVFGAIVSVLSLCLLAQIFMSRRGRSIVNVAKSVREQSVEDASEEEGEALDPTGVNSKV